MLEKCAGVPSCINCMSLWVGSGTACNKLTGIRPVSTALSGFRTTTNIHACTEIRTHNLWAGLQCATDRPSCFRDMPCKQVQNDVRGDDLIMLDALRLYYFLPLRMECDSVLHGNYCLSRWVLPTLLFCFKKFRLIRYACIFLKSTI